MAADRIDPGGSFDRSVVAYDRGRPGWPHAAVDLLDIPASSAVVDLGAGTGKLTQVLCERFARVWAVEPLPGMRDAIGRTAPGAEALAGTAEAIPLAKGSVDAVFAGQSFHWFATDRAAAEIARVLKPGGTLALLWNVPDPERPSPLPAGYRARFTELREEIRRPEPGWRDVIARGPFGPVREATVPNEQVSARDDVLAFAASQSWIACRPDAERTRVIEELAALLPPGRYRFPLRTDVYWSERSK